MVIRGSKGIAALLALLVLSLAHAAQPPSPELFPVDWHERDSFLVDVHPAVAGEALALEGVPVYHLDWLLESSQSLVGRQEVLVTNDSGEAWESVYFHLHPNLLDADLDLDSVRLDGQDAGYRLEEDGWLLRLELPAPLDAGESAVVSLDYRLEVPTTASRNYGILAFRDGTLSLAHGYAILAVYDEEGWDLDLPPTHGDLVYARAGFYRARIEAPARFEIVTSGSLVDRAVEGDTQRLEIRAGPVRDFYLAADEGLESVESLSGAVSVRGHAPPHLLGAMEDAVEQAARSVEFLGGLYGSYPHLELDLVVISTEALGVEFPGVIALRREILSGRERRELLESTVVHEVVHQWFYGMVGNDQVSEPWLDESLTQYLTLRYFLAFHGVEGYRSFRQGLLSRWGAIDRRRIPIGLPVAAYEPQEYGAVVYGLGPLVMEWLAGLLERPRFDAFLEEYVDRNRFEIARPEEFMSLANEYCRCELEVFFTTWVTGEEVAEPRASPAQPRISRPEPRAFRDRHFRDTWRAGGAASRFVAGSPDRDRCPLV